MSFCDVRVRNSNEETMSPPIESRVLVSVCETNLNYQFKRSFRDTRDRNSQQETTSLPTRWNKNKKQNRDGSRVVSKTFREDMSYPASARNIPNDILRRSKACWQDDDINTCHQTHMPIELRRFRSEGPGSALGSRCKKMAAARASSAENCSSSLAWWRNRFQRK